MVADLADFYDDKQSNAEMQKYREAQEDLDRKHLPLFVSMDIFPYSWEPFIFKFYLNLITWLIGYWVIFNK